AFHPDRSRPPALRSHYRRSGDVHQALEDHHAALPAGRAERAIDGVQVRGIRRRADVRPVAEEPAPPLILRMGMEGGMRIRFLTLAGVAAVAIGVASFLSATLAGQTQTSSASPRPALPAAEARTPEGFPDLQGVYNTATLTPLERPDPNKLVLSEDEA